MCVEEGRDPLVMSIYRPKGPCQFSDQLCIAIDFGRHNISHSWWQKPPNAEAFGVCTTQALPRSWSQSWWQIQHYAEAFSVCTTVAPWFQSHAMNATQTFSQGFFLCSHCLYKDQESTHPRKAVSSRLFCIPAFFRKHFSMIYRETQRNTRILHSDDMMNTFTARRRLQS